MYVNIDAGDMMEFWIYQSFINLMKKCLLSPVTTKILLYYVNKYANICVLHIQPVYTTYVVYSTYELRITVIYLKKMSSIQIMMFV
jgi:hypothetical protein